MIRLVNGTLINDCAERHTYEYVFASDLMSDILRVFMDESTLMVTGLSTVQAIRTAEMANISCVIVARDKKVTDDMLELARDNRITLISSALTLFEISGKLYANGLKPVY